MPMPFEDLEQVYDFLAGAIDQAGPEWETVFLAKAVLGLAHALGDREAALNILTRALADLEPTEPAPGSGARGH